MLLSFLGQLWNTVNTPRPQEHYVPLGNVHWKIRGCRNLSVCGVLYIVYDASVKSGFPAEASLG